MINSVTIIGRLTRDPESSMTATSVTIARFTIAVDNYKKDQPTMFFECRTFGNVSENVTRFCRKGDLVCVVGSLSQRTFDAKDGTKKSIVEIIGTNVEFLTPKKKDEQPVADEPRQTEPQSPIATGSQNLPPQISDDDLPF